MKARFLPAETLSDLERSTDRLSRSLPEIESVESRRWDVAPRVKPHTHEDLYQIDYFDGGEGTYTIDARRHRVSRELVFLVPPGRNHAIVSSEHPPLCSLTAKFRLHALEPGFVAAAISLEGRDTERVSDLLRQIVSEAVLKTHEHRFLASLRLAELLYFLMQVDRRGGANGDVNPIVTGASRYISQHAGEKLSLDDVARAAGVAAEHLCRVFKRQTGETPFAFLRRLRVERACDLLSQPGARMGDVARQTGFTGTRDMGRCFQRLLSMSPRQYLRRTTAGGPKKRTRRRESRQNGRNERGGRGRSRTNSKERRHTR